MSCYLCLIISREKKNSTVIEYVNDIICLRSLFLATYILLFREKKKLNSNRIRDVTSVAQSAPCWLVCWYADCISWAKCPIDQLASRCHVILRAKCSVRPVSHISHTTLRYNTTIFIIYTWDHALRYTTSRYKNKHRSNIKETHKK